MKFAFIGAGAVGGYYGALLARQGHEVSFVARGAHLEAIQRSGLRVVGPLGDFTVRPRAESDPARLGPADVVVLAMKTYDNETAIPMIRPLMTAKTTVLTLQNGVDSAEDVATVVGEAATIAGPTYVATAIDAPGVIKQTGTHRRIVLGEYFNPGPAVSERVRAIEQAMLGADIHAEAVADARIAIWEKFSYLAPVRRVSPAPRVCRSGRSGPMRIVAAMFLDGGRGSRQGRSRVWHHAAARSARKDRRATSTQIPPSTRSSLLIDLSQGKRIEVESLQGTVVRRGRAVGVPTPMIGALYAALKLHAAGQPSPYPNPQIRNSSFLNAPPIVNSPILNSPIKMVWRVRGSALPQLPPALDRPRRVVRRIVHAAGGACCGTSRCWCRLSARAWRSGMVGLVRVVPIVLFSMLSGVAADVLDRRKLMLDHADRRRRSSRPSWRRSRSRGLHRRLADLRARGDRRGGRRVRSAGAPRAGADARAARAPAERDQPQHGRWCRPRRSSGPALGGLIIAIGNVGWAYAFNAVSFLFVVVALLMMRDVPATDRGDGARARRDLDRRGARRPAVRVPLADDPIDDAAGFLRDVLLRRRRRCCRSSRRTSCTSARAGYGWLVRRAGRRRDHRAARRWCRSSHRIDAARADARLGGRRPTALATVVFGVSRSFWLTFACLALVGRERRRQHGDPQPRAPARDAGRDARPDDRRQHGVLHGRPAARRARGGPGRQWLGAPFSVITGGIGCLVATGAIAAVTPELRHYTRNEAVRQ